MSGTLDSGRAWKLLGLAGVAVAGSLVYGASAGAVMPAGAVRWSAAMLTLSTGCSWVTFGVLLLGLTRKPIFDLAEACLVAMAYGEAILVPGSIVNWLMLHANVGVPVPALFNGCLVLTATLVMAFVLSARLQELGVPKILSLCLWILGLNGSWILLVALLSRILPGGR